MLHVTNGDGAAEVLRASGVVAGGAASGGEAEGVLPWRDVLHDGPVPASLVPEELAAVRASYLAGDGHGADEGEVRRFFAERNRRLLAAGEVCLWLEHDVYDQLQFLEMSALLDGVTVEDDERAVFLIAIDDHPEVDDFRGLGQLSPDQMAALWPQRRRLGRQEISWAARGWQAFRAPRPAALVEWLEEPAPEGSLVPAAMTRWLAEYPAVESGLAHSETVMLRALVAGPLEGHALFKRHLASGDRLLFGDTSFALRLAELAAGELPLVAADGDGWQASYRLLPAGRQVLDGEVDRVSRAGIDRWLGGVHLQGRSLPVRWHPGEERLVSESPAGG
ncbi:MAG: hypothetical protein AAF604_04215 [Acidobacteriota bacterium]